MVALPIQTWPISRKQAAFINSDQWMTGICAGRGFGKTKAGCIVILSRAKRDDPWMAISPDNNMIRETTLPTFLETAQFTGQYIKHNVSPTPRVWFRTFDGGRAEIVFKGAEKPDKLRGPSKAGLWFDEASIIHKDAFDIGIACCRHRGVMGPVFATFTPRGFKHWTFESFFDRIPDGLIDSIPAKKLKYFQGRAYLARKDTRLIQASTKDNPFAPPEFFERVSANYSSMLASQELEGDYVEISGLIFKREWLSKTVQSVPRQAMRVRVWDKAATADGACYTVGLLMAKDPHGLVYVEDVVRGQWSFQTRNEIIKQTCEADFQRYGGTVLTYIEQEGGGDGKSVMEQMIRMLGKYPVFRLSSNSNQWKVKGAIRLPGDAKVRRALPFAAQCEAGNVRLLANAKWSADFIEELTAFPEYAVCDQVDAAAYAWLCLNNLPDQYQFASRDVVTKTENPYGDTIELGSDSVMRYGDLPWNKQ